MQTKYNIISAETARKYVEEALPSRIDKLYKSIFQDIFFASKEGLREITIFLNSYLELDPIFIKNSLLEKGYTVEEINTHNTLKKASKRLVIKW